MTDLEIDPENAFCRDIPEDERQNLREMMCEAAHNPLWKDPSITILDRERKDAINVRVQGIITFFDREYSFIMRSGDWDGDVLEGWEDSGVQEFEHSPPVIFALAPNAALIDSAIARNDGPFLVKKWDIICARPKIEKIVRNYAYDRFFQPGCYVENYYKTEAEKQGFVIVRDDEAARIRARLLEAKL